VARGAQAFWTGADVTVLNATAALCDTATKAKIPVFSNSSGQVREGTLFDLGANYLEVGYNVGALAASILDGRNPATVVITNFMPERVMLNKQMLKKMRDPWRFPNEFTIRAELIIGENGQVEKDAANTPKEGQAVLPRQMSNAPVIKEVRKPLSKRWRIQQAIYLESVMVEDAMRGFHDGLKEAGLREGADFTTQMLSAQGDMAALGTLIDSGKTSGADLYVVYGTPTLQTAIRKVQDTPVVFTVVADPFVVGAGKTDLEHLPNLTGVYTQGPYREMAELLREHFPSIKRIGTLFCPAEANSVANKDTLVREAHRCGLTVETVAANGPSELPDAAMALCGRRLDAIVQVVDNLSAAGFTTISRAAAQIRLPVFACQESAIKQGAMLVLTRDYYDAGRETALKAARVMEGENPLHIPFSPPTKVKKLANLKHARESQLVIPDALLRELQQVDAP
jgi:ABC-type uncharacterized transport system substrate-binding protein